ncbi:MAG: hypothetical protein HQM10_04055 [Candidatus Riflebacteria bacterium]|nr:hypothetical protein [Candidatus Riflebacteria bacterium]
MKLFKIILALVFALSIFFPVWAQDDSQATTPSAVVDDLTKSYETWKGKGIKFVIRKDGKFETWGIGRLESWNNNSKWVVRNPKGRFLIHASGKIENWKNGKTLLVLRESKGRMLTHIKIDLTSHSCFAKNVVGLRKLKADHKYIAFVQETLTELLLKELKSNDRVRTKVLLDYLNKYKNEKSGMSNFKPVIKEVSKQLNFMAAHGDDSVIKSMAEEAAELVKELK